MEFSSFVIRYEYVVNYNPYTGQQNVFKSLCLVTAQEITGLNYSIYRVMNISQGLENKFDFLLNKKI